MPSLPYDALKSAFAGQSLFEDKTWRLSPEAWPLTAAQVEELEAIGTASLEFHQALETLYLRSVAGKNLLRNKPLMAPWVAEYLERGKPEALVAHARDPKTRGQFPTVLRPDLLLTDDGLRHDGARLGPRAASASRPTSTASTRTTARSSAPTTRWSKTSMRRWRA
jgi:hypothetical protein